MQYQLRKATQMAKGIFINYRRNDTQTEAKLLYDFLNQYEDVEIFYDIDRIEYGEDFYDKIENVIEKETDIVLVLIGAHWEHEIEQRHGIVDFVAEEIELAFTYRKRVIPVLFYRNMPDVKAIPNFNRVEINFVEKKNSGEIRWSIYICHKNLVQF